MQYRVKHGTIYVAGKTYRTGDVIENPDAALLASIAGKVAPILPPPEPVKPEAAALAPTATKESKGRN